VPDKEHLDAVAEQIRSGDPAAARRGLEPLLAQCPDDVELRDLEAELLLRERRPRLALAAIETALESGGETPGRLTLAGRCLNNLGLLPDAERSFRRAIAIAPTYAPALAGLGHVLRRVRRTAEAEDALRKAIEVDPVQAGSLRTLGLLCLSSNRAKEAAGLFQRALASAPDDPGTLGYLGVALHKTGESEAAVAAYRRALELLPADLGTRLNLGITLQERGRIDEAIEAYAEAADRHPSSEAALHRLADALLASGRCEDALVATDRVLALDPGHPAAVAKRIVALQRLGRTGEAANLSGLDTLVRAVDPDPPAGFDDASQFNRALVRHVLDHPTLAYEPDGHATRLGRHTRDLLTGEKGPAGLLEAIILKAVDDYLAALALPEGHPFPGVVPTAHRLAMWAVVMDTDGYQMPHIHPSAWLSGVYYPELPESLGRGGADVAGWIEFGLAAEEFRGGTDMPVKLFRPAEGRMFLFPSYLYHRTIPFGGDARRVSIAFDVKRKPAP
jgi:tetratricopeptide (TPR) repeat protein